MIHDKHYKTEKARRQGKNQKNKAQKRNWFTRVRVLFFARRAFAQPHRAARAGPAIARRSPLRAGARQACSTVRGEGANTPASRTARRPAVPCLPCPAPQAAVRQRGPRAPHRPPARLARQPALPFCPSRAGAAPRQRKAPRAAGRARGETYLPFSGRGARLIFWLQGPQNPRPQALR